MLTFKCCCLGREACVTNTAPLQVLISFLCITPHCWKWHRALSKKQNHRLFHHIKGKKGKLQFIIFLIAAMLLDFSLLLAPLLPGFHFLGSACPADSLGASCPGGSPWSHPAPPGSPGEFPRTPHPTPAAPWHLAPATHPGSWLLALVLVHVHTFPPTYCNTLQVSPAPGFHQVLLTGSAGSSPPPALPTHCPLKCQTLEGLSSGTAWSYRHQSTFLPALALLGPPGLRRGATLPGSTGSPKLLQCSVLSQTQLIPVPNPAHSCPNIAQSHPKPSSFLSSDLSEHDAQQGITGHSPHPSPSLYFTSLPRKRPGKKASAGMALKSCFCSTNQALIPSAASTESFQRWLCKQEFFTYCA